MSDTDTDTAPALNGQGDHTPEHDAHPEGEGDATVDWAHVHTLVTSGDYDKVQLTGPIAAAALNEGARRWPGLPLPQAWTLTVLLLEGLEHAAAKYEEDARKTIARLPECKGVELERPKPAQVYPGTKTRVERVADDQFYGATGMRLRVANLALHLGTTRSSKRKPVVHEGVNTLAELATPRRR